MFKPIQFGIFALLLVAALGYWASLPTPPKAVTDPRAREALQLVQTHPAREAPTIQQAILDIVRKMEERGQQVRMGEWRVAPQGPDTYVVSLLIREKGFSEWIERDYAWRVNLKDKSIRIITLPPTHIMPFHELPPLPMDPANL